MTEKSIVLTKTPDFFMILLPQQKGQTFPLTVAKFEVRLYIGSLLTFSRHDCYVFSQHSVFISFFLSYIFLSARSKTSEKHLSLSGSKTAIPVASSTRSRA